MEPLGEGGQGSTFRGIDRDTKREVAIKVLSLKATRNWKAFDLFEREVSVLKSLDHPALPRYIDSYASEDTGDFFVVMSLVEGVPLSRYVAGERRLPPGGLRKILEDGLSILEYLHGLSPPVVHRDIKPANLLLATSGRLSLVDFGGVRLAAKADGGSTMIGTFGYMAPEQLHGQSSPAVDIYALGATVCALHAGAEADTLPHEGLRLSVEELELPETLAPVVAKMVEPDPRLRLATVAAVRRELAAVPRRLSGSEIPEPEPGRTKGPVTDLVPRGEEPDELVPLEDMPAVMRALARTPFPLSFLVWLITALSAGTLVVYEVVLMPIIALVGGLIANRNEDPAVRKKLDKDLEQMRDIVGSTRRALSWVAEETSPVRDRDRRQHRHHRHHHKKRRGLRD